MDYGTRTTAEPLSLRIPLAGVIAILVGSFAVIEASNADFKVFDPVVLNVAMFMVLVGLAGSATAYGDRVFQRRLPFGTLVGIAYGVLIGFGALLAFPLTFVSFFVDGAFSDDSPRVAGGFFLVATVGALLSWTRYTPWHMPITSKAGTWIGTFALAGLLAFSGLHLVGEIRDIL